MDEFAAKLGVRVQHYTSNIEGEILNYIHGVADEVDAFMINPAGLTMFGTACPSWDGYRASAACT